MSTPITEGATALKLENEIQEEKVNEVEQQLVNIEDNLTSSEALNENSSEDLNTHSVIDEQVETNNETTVSNGLENFEIQEETPELFNSENLESPDETKTDEVNSSEEEELEIPAFLRRQKN